MTPNAEYRTLCHLSFARPPQDHTRPADHPGWGICVACGEVVNVRGREIPEHRRPGITWGSWAMVQRQRPICRYCQVRFTDDEWDIRHSDSDGEDVHADCCDICHGDDPFHITSSEA